MFHHVVRYALRLTLFDHYFFQLTGIVRILCFPKCFKKFERIPLFICQFDFHIVDRFCTYIGFWVCDSALPVFI